MSYMSVSYESVEQAIRPFLQAVEVYHPVVFLLVKIDLQVIEAAMIGRTIELVGIGWGVPDLYAGRDAAWRLYVAASSLNSHGTAAIFHELYGTFVDMVQG